MFNYIKNTFLKPKNTAITAFIVIALAISSFEIVNPQTTKADYLLDNYSYLSNLSASQDNTLIAIAKPSGAASTARKIKMVVTAYSSTVAQTDSTPFITASGSTVRDGIVANNLLPFGTKIRIPDLYGDKVFTVEDRMNRKKGGYHVDIWFASTHEAQHFGSEISYIEVLQD